MKVRVFDPLFERLVWRRKMKDLIIKTKCPFCSFEQNTVSLKAVSCNSCGRRYKVYPEGKRARIVGIVKGSQALLLRKRQLLTGLPKIGEP